LRPLCDKPRRLLHLAFKTRPRGFSSQCKRACTVPQIADELSKLLGHPIVYVSRSLEEERAALIANGLTPFVADLLVGLEQMFRDSVLGETTSTVQALTGEPPRTLSQWLAENIAAFRK
jgi:NAD(P)H dehydrogenase (quinone)